MSDISEATRQFWIETLLSWAEDRLMPPQMDECRRALDWRAAVEQAERAAYKTTAQHIIDLAEDIENDRQSRYSKGRVVHILKAHANAVIEMAAARPAPEPQP